MTQRDVTKLARTTAAAVMLVLLAAVWRHYQPPNRNIAFPAGEIRIGVDGSYPPFAFDEAGNLAGLDIELGEAIAGEIGLPVRYVNISFYGLYDALITGEVDLLIAALRVDPARTNDARYTEPYFDDGLVLVSAPGNRPISADALSGVTIAYEYASRADSRIRRWESDGHVIARMPYELSTYALDALRLGQAEAALVDAASLRLYARERREWQYQHQFVSREPYAIAVRIDRDEAFKLVDHALSTLKESGEVARIVAKWF